VNEADATRAVVEMFGAIGRSPGDEIVKQLARDVRASSCQSCAKGILDAWTQNGVPQSFQPVPTFRSKMAEAIRSADHFDHVGQDERSVDVGKLEGEYRGKIAEAIREELDCDRDQASYLAAVCWETGTPPDVGVIREQLLGPDGHRASWVVGALIYLGTHDAPKTIDQAWRRARTYATVGEANVSEEDWAALTQEFRKEPA